MDVSASVLELVQNITYMYAGLKQKIRNPACPFVIGMKCGLCGALPSWQVSNKSCLLGRKIYLPWSTRQGFSVTIALHGINEHLSIH